jgi:tripartite-type tricarboxylate transporter receptor subunit TctC
MNTVRFVRACAASILLACGATWAQQYPVKPVRVVIVFPPGGATDVVGRIAFQKVSEQLNQQFIIDNRVGAGGTIGAAFVAKSAPDGYTLLLTDLGGLVISASVYPKLPFNPSKDFTPVVMVSYSPHVLAVNPDVEVKNVKELVTLAKAYPGKLNFAISGIGGAPQLAGIEFAQRTGIDWTYIPYKGGADGITGVIGRQAHVLFNGMLATWPHVTGGRLRAIAISSAKRMPSAPDVPTVAEQGLPGFETGSFQGVVGPLGIPRETVAKLNAELSKVLNTTEMKERFAKQGTEVRTDTPDSLGKWMTAEQAKWAKVVKESGAKFD